MAENNERTFTQSEAEALFKEFERRLAVKDDLKSNETPLPVEIVTELENLSPSQHETNFKKFKRESHKYLLDEWTTPEKINRSVYPELKKHTVEKSQVVNQIYKLTDNTRFQAKQQPKYLNNSISSQPETWEKQKCNPSSSGVENKVDNWQSLDSSKPKNKNEKQKTRHLKPLDFQIASSIWNTQKKMTREQTMTLTQNFLNNWKKQDFNSDSYSKPVVIEDEIMSAMDHEEDTNLEVVQEEPMDMSYPNIL